MTAISIFQSTARKNTATLGVLVSLLLWANPGALALASNPGPVSQPLVFEAVGLPKPLLDEPVSLKASEISQNDPLVNNLKLYLEKHRSPLAEYADQIVLQEDWQKALAISWVESNFGRFCFDDNCSGIGVKPGHPSWRKYPNKLAWFKDLSKLLQKPLYKDKYNTCRKMKGVYVQPGSANWVRGCEQKFNELTKLTDESKNQRAVLALEEMEKLALTTFPVNNFQE